jgi:hypothetical protein
MGPVNRKPDENLLLSAVHTCRMLVKYDSILPGPLPMSAPTVMPAQVFELISKTNR